MDVFIGTIVAWAPNFVPLGWLPCDGRMLKIAQYQPLYSLIGTTYGGSGDSFALPDLRGRVPIGDGQSSYGPSYVQGALSGEKSVTLSFAEIPVHAHAILGSSASANTDTPVANTCLAKASDRDSDPVSVYSTAINTSPVNMASTSSVGGNGAHNNMQPYLVLKFIICWQGLYPERS